MSSKRQEFTVNCKAYSQVLKIPVMLSIQRKEYRITVKTCTRNIISF